MFGGNHVLNVLVISIIIDMGADMNIAKKILSVDEFIEAEVENIVALYQDESHDPYIQSDKAIDGEWVWHDHECPDYEMPIVLDNDDVSTINEYIEAVICLIDDQLDTPFPDEHKAWLVWNPNFEIAGGLLRIIPNWEIAFDYYGEQKIIKKRLDKRL